MTRPFPRVTHSAVRQVANVNLAGVEDALLVSAAVQDALGLGDGAEIRTPMAVAVICGLLTSTVLTLLVIPTIYYLFGLAGQRFFQAREE